MAYFTQTHKNTLRGIDISTAGGQYPMNFATAYSAGARFVIMKCSQANSTVDANFTTANIAAARAAGLKVGAYHFTDPNGTQTIARAEEEADHFVSTMAAQFADDDWGDLMPMIDFEDTGTTWTDDDTAYNWIEAFANRVKMLTGKTCMLYTAYYYVDGNITGASDLIHSTKGGINKVCPILFLAADEGGAAYNFTEFGGYADWDIWQYSSDGNGMGATYGASSADIDIDDFTHISRFASPPIVTGLSVTPLNGGLRVRFSKNSDEGYDVTHYVVKINDVIKGVVTADGREVYETEIFGLANDVEVIVGVAAVDAYDYGFFASTTATPSGSSTDGTVSVLYNTKTGLANIPTFEAATSGGDYVKNEGGNTVILVANASGGQITVTVESITLCGQGVDHDITITIDNGDTKAIALTDTDRFNNSSEIVKVTCSSVTSVTIAAVNLYQ